MEGGSVYALWVSDSCNVDLGLELGPLIAPWRMYKNRHLRHAFPHSALVHIERRMQRSGREGCHAQFSLFRLGIGLRNLECNKDP